MRNPQPATRNPQPATRNPQPATRNPQPATRNHQPSTINHQHLKKYFSLPVPVRYGTCECRPTRSAHVYLSSVLWENLIICLRQAEKYTLISFYFYSCWHEEDACFAQSSRVYPINIMSFITFHLRLQIFYNRWFWVRWVFNLSCCRINFKPKMEWRSPWFEILQCLSLWLI